MMGWTLAILFSTAAVLLILSFIKANKAVKEQEQEHNTYYAATMKEIEKLQEQLRTIELDNEILIQESGMNKSHEEVQLMREILDLQKRKYSLESIATRTNLSVNEVENMLAPYSKPQVVRGNVANDS